LIIFSEEFDKTDCKPFIYKDKLVMMWDRIPVSIAETRIFYRIVSTNSEWRQGFSIATKGETESSDEIIVSKGWGDIWEDISPHEGEIKCRSKNGLLEVKNIWDTGNGCIESWNNGAAMWYEEIPNGRRYHCNDGHFDDDFDDIVFEIVILDGE